MSPARVLYAMRPYRLERGAGGIAVCAAGATVFPAPAARVTPTAIEPRR